MNLKPPDQRTILRTSLFVLLGLVMVASGVIGSVETVKGEEIKKRVTAKVVIFMDSGCPIARYHTRTLRLLHAEFSSKGVIFEGAFPNATATAKSVAAFTDEFEIPFKTGVDEKQALAKKLKAKVVPEVFVFDASNDLVYRGRIDDSFPEIGRKRPVTRSHDLRDALTAIVNGKAPKDASTQAVGCSITFTRTTPPLKSD